jgi:hypothetical protein
VDLGENNHETKRPEVLIVVKLSKIQSKMFFGFWVHLFCAPKSSNQLHSSLEGHENQAILILMYYVV